MNVEIPSLSSNAMLVYISVSVWSARKLDRKQTAMTVKAAGATSDAARVNKHLLANADSLLRDVQRKANEARTYIEENTLPWDDAGNRIISNDRALVVVGDLNRISQEFSKLVDRFVIEYPVLRAQALQNLGDMANDDDYPQPDVVRGKFSMRLSFNPIPTGFGDFRVGMSEQQARAWQAHFEGNVKAQMNAALRNAYERLRENLQRYSDTLQPRPDDPEKMKIFRDSMVEQMRDTVALVSSLNVFGDVELDRLSRDIHTQVARYSADELRASPATAIAVKSEVDDMLARMQSILG
jgi:uncharacterized membrane-anchored protein YhcB (DUF1043 family)